MYSMKEFSCEFCDYKTGEIYNYERHLSSKRHFKKVNSQDMEEKNLSKIIQQLSCSYPSENDKSYTCDKCGNIYKHQSGLSKHKKICTGKKIAEVEFMNKLKDVEREKEMEKKEKELAKKEINMLHKQQKMHEQHVSLLRQLIITSTKGTNGSITSTLYEHYSNNPPLKQIEYTKLCSLLRPKSKLVKEMISCYKHNTLHEFLGNFILDIYKKKNYSEQSIFASDTSRLTYMIKETVYENTSEWVPDKKGVKTINYIIRPLTLYVIDLINEFEDKNKPLEDANPEDVEEYIRLKDETLRLKMYIEDGKLDDRLNKFICPYLIIDKNQVRKISSNTKKIPALDYKKLRMDN